MGYWLAPSKHLPSCMCHSQTSTISDSKWWPPLTLLCIIWKLYKCYMPELKVPIYQSMVNRVRLYQQSSCLMPEPSFKWYIHFYRISLYDCACADARHTQPNKDYLYVVLLSSIRGKCFHMFKKPCHILFACPSYQIEIDLWKFSIQAHVLIRVLIVPADALDDKY